MAGTAYQGLFLINTFNRSISPISPANQPQVLKSIVITTILESKTNKNHYWLGTFGDGLHIYSQTANQINSYKNIFSDNYSLSNNFILSLCQDSQDMLWIGTIQGLNRFNSQESKFFRYYMSDSAYSLSSSQIYYIAEDHTRQLWIATDNGLNKYNRAKDQFEHFPGYELLLNHKIFRIIPGKDLVLWLLTDKGLVLFDLITAKVYYYSDKDNSKTPLSYPSPSVYDNHGNIILSNGFQLISLTPNLITFSTSIPEIVLTELSINGKAINSNEKINGRIAFDKELSEAKTINLPENHGQIEFSFAVLNLKNPLKNHLYYRLKGFDHHWLHINAPEKAVYPSLFPGTYHFQFKGSAATENSCISPLKTIIIKVHPQFWRTIWFKFIVFFILIGLFYLFNAIRKAQRDDRKNRIDDYVKDRSTGDIPASPEKSDGQPKKYLKSNLTWEQTERYLKMLLNYMEVEKPFTESNLTIKILAEKLQIPQRSLSQVINEKLNQNFLDFINRYRIEEAKRQLIISDNEDSSILDIAFYVGFNSKSTFNTVFKKYVKMTPSKFRKKYKQKPD
jgi:AraC-like DNA-binding protein